MKEKIIAKNLQQLILIIDYNIKMYGYNCNLNHIDVSNITDMSNLFSSSKFNGNISKWNISNVTTMSEMFLKSEFNQDISSWDVSNVENMYKMFDNSIFNQNISNWDVSKVTSVLFMFSGSKFNQDLTNWKPLNLKYHKLVFNYCSAPLPYWAETDNISAAVRSYSLNKEIDSSLIYKNIKSNKVKI